MASGSGRREVLKVECFSESSENTFPNQMWRSRFRLVSIMIHGHRVVYCPASPGQTTKRNLNYKRATFLHCDHGDAYQTRILCNSGALALLFGPVSSQFRPDGECDRTNTEPDSPGPSAQISQAGVSSDLICFRIRPGRTQACNTEQT